MYLIFVLYTSFCHFVFSLIALNFKSYEEQEACIAIALFAIWQWLWILINIWKVIIHLPPVTWQ